MSKETKLKYRAYLGIKFHEDNRNKGQVESIRAALQDEGVQTVCIARDVEKWGEVSLSSRELMRISFDEIDESDFVILEMSEKGVGLGIEAGYAVARNIPLIILIKHGLKLSNTMQGIATMVIPYSHPAEVRISRHINSLHGTPAASTQEGK